MKRAVYGIPPFEASMVWLLTGGIARVESLLLCLCFGNMLLLSFPCFSRIFGSILEMVRKLGFGRTTCGETLVFLPPMLICFTYPIKRMCLLPMSSLLLQVVIRGICPSLGIFMTRKLILLVRFFLALKVFSFPLYSQIKGSGLLSLLGIFLINIFFRLCSLSITLIIISLPIKFGCPLFFKGLRPCVDYCASPY